MGDRVSQQLDRAGVRPADSPGLLTYTGQVMLVGDPEYAKNPPHKERPRKILISDRPGQYQGKTFRIWVWREAEFEQLKVGAWVTVHYEIEPNPNPERHGSNMISVVETVEQGAGSGGGEPQPPSGEVRSNAGEAPTPSPDAWSTPPTQDWAATKDVLSKDDYWAQREASDHERTLEIESAWAIRVVLDNADGQMSDDQVIDKALQLVIMKRRLASELGNG